MANNITLEIPKIPAGLVKKRISVPRRSAEIPQVGNYKKNIQNKKNAVFALIRDFKLLLISPVSGIRANNKKNMLSTQPIGCQGSPQVDCR
jgi:hypothetical protein